MNKNSYVDSNSVLNVRLNSFRASYSHDLLKCGETVDERNRVAIKLLKYLCDKFNINMVQLYVLNEPQRKLKHSKVLGDYNLRSKSIRIYNLTATTKKVVSIKVFYDTLLHEFIHHYDIEVLRLDSSLHTSGFYQRISDLKVKLG